MNDVVFFNAKVYLEKGHFAQAVLVKDGLIAQVGQNEAVLAAAGKARQYDCQGKTLIPGLNDSHLHIAHLGDAMNTVSLADCKSVEGMVEKCRDYMAKNPELTARGFFSQTWNQDNFDADKRRLPNRHDLDKISTTVPIVLSRICGHSAAVNTKALELMGVKLAKDHLKIDGGEIITDENGIPTGYLTEMAIRPAKKVLPPPTPAARTKTMLDAMKYAVEHGLTSIQSNDVGSVMPNLEEGFAILKNMYDEGKAPIRYRAQVTCQTMDLLKTFIASASFKSSSHQGHLAIGPLKMFKDGSLGARTALVRHEYLDQPGNYGVEVINDATQAEMVKYANSHGLQVVTHVIGDAAIEKTINAYESADPTGKNPLRNSLIHCQITDKALMERIKKANIYIAYQPVFLEYDLHAVESRCGKELSSTSYAFKTAAQLGIHASYGSDCPVEDCNPFLCIYCAVTRKDYKGFPAGGFYPQECVDVPTAIDAYTLESAAHENQEHIKGRIKAGYYADLVLLDTDIFTVEPDLIKNILPVMTMVGGKIVYQK